MIHARHHRAIPGVWPARIVKNANSVGLFWGFFWYDPKPRRGRSYTSELDFVHRGAHCRKLAPPAGADAKELGRRIYIQHGRKFNIRPALFSDHKFLFCCSGLHQFCLPFTPRPSRRGYMVSPAQTEVMAGCCNEQVSNPIRCGQESAGTSIGILVVGNWPCSQQPSR